MDNGCAHRRKCPVNFPSPSPSKLKIVNLVTELTWYLSWNRSSRNKQEKRTDKVYLKGQWNWWTHLSLLLALKAEEARTGKTFGGEVFTWHSCTVYHSTPVFPSLPLPSLTALPSSPPFPPFLSPSPYLIYVIATSYKTFPVRMPSLLLPASSSLPRVNSSIKHIWECTVKIS